MPRYLVVNDKGEYFVAFKQAPIGPRCITPQFAAFNSPGMSVMLMDESELAEMETDLKKFDINYRLIEVSS